MLSAHLLIDGKHQAAHGGATFERRNPLDDSVASVAAAASPANAIAAVEAASRAFEAWSRTGPGEARAPAFANSGQSCMSTERIVVDESVADVFVERLGAKAAGLAVGDPRSADAAHRPLGAVVDHATVERCNALIDGRLVCSRLWPRHRARLVGGAAQRSASHRIASHRIASHRAFATSMAPRFTTRRKCPLAVSRPRAMAASAARPVSRPLPICAG